MTRSDTASIVFNIVAMSVIVEVDSAGSGAALAQRCLDILAPLVKILARSISAVAVVSIISSAIMGLTAGNTKGASDAARATQNREVMDVRQRRGVSRWVSKRAILCPVTLHSAPKAFVFELSIRQDWAGK